MSDPKPTAGHTVTNRAIGDAKTALPSYAKTVSQQASPIAEQFKKADLKLNPEFYKTRELAGAKTGELLGSINLNNANPEAERLISQENARSGNIGNPQNATNTLANALSFGKELDARRQSLGNAIGTANNFLPASRTNFNPLTAAQDMGQGLLDTSTGVQTQKQDLTAARRQGDERVNDAIGSC